MVFIASANSCTCVLHGAMPLGCSCQYVLYHNRRTAVLSHSCADGEEEREEGGVRVDGVEKRKERRRWREEEWEYG